MPKCKNCYHKDICVAFLDGSEMPDCDYFKDKSLIAELPCKVDDTMYKIEGGEIYTITVSHIIIDDLNIEFHGFEIDEEGNEFNEDSIWLSELGKTVFLTREEAEKALEG